MRTFLKGKKSYLMALALLAYAVGGYFTGHLTQADAIGLVWGSGVTASLRAGINNAPSSN